MKEGRNGNIKADEVKRAYFSANPPETNEAHDLEEDELEANSSMVRRQVSVLKPSPSVGLKVLVMPQWTVMLSSM